jgi:GNAT superfamily N-acetyltransferase
VRSGIVIRRAEPHRVGEVGFITNAWLNSLQDSSMFWDVPRPVFFKRCHDTLAEILGRSAVLVVAAESDPDHIIGFICYEVFDNALVIHYVYIKQLFRKQGIAKELYHFVREAEDRGYEKPVFVTFRTDKSSKITRKYKNRFIFDPWLGMGGLLSDRKATLRLGT